MKKFFFSLILIISCTYLFSEGVSFSGDIVTKWGVFAPWTDDKTANDFSLGNTNFTGKVDTWYGNSSAFAQGSINYDALTNQINFSLSELWIDYSESNWGLRIGRQKVAWGKADGVDITNVICPSDMSSFSAMISDDSKLAVDAIRFSFTGNQFTADTYWIPFFTPMKLQSNQLSVLSSLEKPETSIWNGEYGLKLSGYFSALDFSLYGFYGWDDTPFIDYKINISNPTVVNVSGNYKNMTMVGIDTAIPLGPTVIRSEAAFFPKKHFQKTAQKIIQENMTGKAETTQKLNQLNALIGLDWMPSGWTITAQYFCDYVFGNLENTERQEAYTHGTTLSLSKSFVNETLEVSISGLMNFNDFDSLINPAITYSISDQISIAGGAYILLPGPENDGTYGAYKDLSTIYINAKYSF